MKDKSPSNNNSLFSDITTSNKDKQENCDDHSKKSDPNNIMKTKLNNSNNNDFASPSNKSNNSIFSNLNVNNSSGNNNNSANKFAENLNNSDLGNQNFSRNNNNNNNTKDQFKEKTFVIKNGCCRDCMKAFSKSGKSCLCQVPKHERKYILPDKGCNFCGCKGCNPLDIRKEKRREMKKKLQNDNDILFKRQRIIDSEDEEILTNQKDSDDYNRNRSDLDKLLSVYFKNFGYVGYGAPMRSSSYILGYNPKFSDISSDHKKDDRHQERRRSRHDRMERYDRQENKEKQERNEKHH